MPRTREVTDAVEIHARVQLVPQFYELLTANVTTTPKGCEPLGGPAGCPESLPAAPPAVLPHCPPTHTPTTLQGEHRLFLGEFYSPNHAHKASDSQGVEEQDAAPHPRAGGQSG